MKHGQKSTNISKQTSLILVTDISQKNREKNVKKKENKNGIYCKKKEADKNQLPIFKTYKSPNL